MIECRVATCDAQDAGELVGAAQRGWLVVSPDPTVPVVCPLHADYLTVGSHHVFGPEYQLLPSRVPVDGDTLITKDGIYQRHAGEWVLEQWWDRAGAAA